MTVIVPNVLRDAIKKRIDAFVGENPEAEKDRENIYADMLAAYNHYGELPDLIRPDYPLEKE